MGNAAIWYYPGPGAGLKKIDLGRPLSDLQDQPVRDEAVSQSISGSRTKIVWASWHLVPVSMALFADQSVVRELDALINHLQRGGSCTLAEDDGYPFAAFLATAPERGATTLYYTENLYSEYGTYTPTAGDVLVVQGPGPEYLREEVVLSGVSGRAISIASPGLRFDYSAESWIHVRPKGFWPILRLQEGATNRAHLRHERRITYTLDLALEEPPNALDLAAAHAREPYQGELVDTTDSATGTTIDDVLSGTLAEEEAGNGMAAPQPIGRPVGF